MYIYCVGGWTSQTRCATIVHHVQYYQAPLYTLQHSPSIPVTPNPNPNDDPAAILSNLSPSSRRLISEGLHTQHKRAEASGDMGRLDLVAAESAET